MNELGFEDLIDLLPKCEAFPTNDVLPRGISYGSTIPEFIPPNVALAEGIPGQSQVLVIEAPGAVGKSTLAKAMSSRCGALMWDLAAADEVGYGSLDAVLEHTMRPGLKADFLEWMTEGIQLLIIDALDEGRIKVNENSFTRLLENISRLSKDAKGVCFVLLGRTQIAESVWLSLADQDINVSLLTIEPFTRAQANEYIEKRVESGQSGPIRECRDLVFEQLEAAMKNEPDSESTSAFLHYPPVLDVIVVLLQTERNPMALKNFLESQTPETSVNLLRDVMDHILWREQQKTVPAFIESLVAADQQILKPIVESLYDNDEQSMRLLASVLEVSLDSTPKSLPTNLETAYNSAVGRAMTDHPFLRGATRFANSVFEAYLYAKALRGDFGEDLTNRVTAILLDSPNLPTTLLAEFYLETESSPREVRAEHVGLLYESLLSSESNRRRVRLSIDGDDPIHTPGTHSDYAEGEFEILSGGREGDAGYEPEVIPFSLKATTDSVISFRRYIRDIYLSIPGTVELGANVSEFRIGPSVYICAGRIRIGSEALVVERVPPKYDEYDDASVALEAAAFEAPFLSGSPTVYGHDFSVAWPGDEVFPWRQYRYERNPFETDDNETRRTYLRFKRIATAFQSRGKGTLARSKVKIENPRIMQGELEVALLRTLQQDGILYLGDGGKRYYWSPERANELLGVSWIDLRKGECPEKLRSYLNEFNLANPGL